MAYTKNLVRGVGHNDFKFKRIARGRSYICWKSMLERCYTSNYQKRHPSYIGCTVCHEWLYYSNFKVWYDANFRDKYRMDKDILVRANKIYSPETCAFVPSAINLLLTKCDSKRGKSPIGVSYHIGHKNFRASLKINSKEKYIGTFKTILEAHTAYKIAKETQIQTLAMEYFNRGEIGLNVYTALMNYRVQITD